MSEDSQAQQGADASVGCARTYGVELLYEGAPALPKQALLRALRRLCPDVEPLDGDPQSALLVVLHTAHRVHYDEADIPSQCLIAQADQPLAPEAAQPALEQSWRWPRAKEVVPQCRHCVLVTDLMAARLPYAERLELFQRVVAGVLKVAPCQAIHWGPTQQCVNPADVLNAMGSEGYRQPLPGALNVRFFRIAGHDRRKKQGLPEDPLMDTLGLSALGLTDEQCHFRGLDPAEVSRVLYNTGCYLFEKGPVIVDGHTVQGLCLGEKWLCQHEQSLVAPTRAVLDLNPGPPHAAGKRSAPRRPFSRS